MNRLRTILRRSSWRLRPPVLALGGGGARGFAHLGVLRVVDQEGLSVRAIAGTSMGAVAGSMYLAYGSADLAIARWKEALDSEVVPPVRSFGSLRDSETSEHPLVQLARRIRNRVVISFALNRRAVLEKGALQNALEFLVPDVDIEQLGRPFVAVATDIDSGQEVRLTKGPLRKVLDASSAIPGIVPEVEIDGRWMVDGGVVAEIPIGAARDLGWPVVAVDVSPDIATVTDNDLVLDTMMRTQMMTARLLRRFQMTGATHLIRPAVGDTSWSEWRRFDDLVDAGSAAARRFLGIAD